MGDYVGQAYMELYPIKRMEPVYMRYPWKSLLKSGSNGVVVYEYGRKLMRDMVMVYDVI